MSDKAQESKGQQRGGAGQRSGKQGAQCDGEKQQGSAAKRQGRGGKQGHSGKQGGAKQGGNRNHSGRKTQRHAGGKRGGNARREPAVCNKGEHILFVGFMGCGKSSVSRILHKRSGLPLIDIDRFIEEREGRTIKQIFADEGEAGFRRIETMTLASLAFEEKSIISCGGGICGSAVNRGIVKALGTVVYLKVPCNEAVGRISDPSTRPMLSGPRPVREIYDERLPLYRDVADITINTSGKSVGANVSQVIGALRRRGLL